MPIVPADGDFTALANAHRGGFEHLIGLVFTRVDPDHVACEVPVTDALCQPYGIVHGGVYAAIIETLCSTGAAVNAMPQGRNTVGLDNSTSFLRATRGGTLHGLAVPEHKGRRTHLWSGEVRDDAGRLVAKGQVRVLIVAADDAVGGEVVGLKP